eukprot:scaffold1252_cov124-Isochrysis_galbana.AAC.6
MGKEWERGGGVTGRQKAKGQSVFRRDAASYLFLLHSGVSSLRTRTTGHGQRTHLSAGTRDVPTHDGKTPVLSSPLFFLPPSPLDATASQATHLAQPRADK